MKPFTIVIITISLMMLFYMFMTRNTVRETDAEAAQCMRETGNIYCNGPRGD